MTGANGRRKESLPDGKVNLVVGDLWHRQLEAEGEGVAQDDRLEGIQERRRPDHGDVVGHIVWAWHKVAVIRYGHRDGCKGS